MCGRFAAAWEPSLIGELLHADLAPHLPRPSWNISPQSSIAIALLQLKAIPRLSARIGR